jgi:hypothetical protein
LKDWSIRERNSFVQTPTLVMAGQFDTMSQACHEDVNKEQYAIDFFLIVVIENCR